MSISRKILSALLVCLLLLTGIPFAPAAVQAAAAQQQEDYVPPMPEGFHFTGITFRNSNDRMFYYVEDEPSEYGLTHGYWINASGKRVSFSEDPFCADEGIVNRDPAALPSSYDSRDYGYITPLEKQIGGTCWAHAAAACMEANAIKKGYATADTVNLSEYYVVWHARNSYYEGVTESYNDGPIISDMSKMLKGGFNGTVMQAVGHLSGPVHEANYQFLSTEEEDLIDEMQEDFTFADKRDYDFVVTGSYSFPLDASDNYAAVKQAVMDYGAAEIYYHHDDNYYTKHWYESGNGVPCAYYYGGSMTDTNHAVTIVGWDDGFARENFKEGCQPPADGAWLIKNSWSEKWGEYGYFWLSYEDPALNDCVYTYDIAPRSEFQNVYQYDGFGSASSIRCTMAANVFTAKGSELLTKVYPGKTASSYSFRIYRLSPSFSDPTDGTLLYQQSGDNNSQKYIDLNTPVSLAAGDVFSVVFDNITAINSESNGSASVKYTSNPNESYYYKNGVWTDSDTEDYHNICIRAVTVDTTPSYKVSFACCGKFRQVVQSADGTAALPADVDGYTWVFLHNGEPFDGTGVTGDMTVTAHRYPTDGNVTSCVTDYRCVYCGEEMQETELYHDYACTVTEASPTSIGFDTYYCSKCGDLYRDNIHPYSYCNVSGSSSSNGTLLRRWQICQGNLAVYTANGVLEANNDTWSNRKDSITAIYFMEGTQALGDGALPDYPAVTELHLPSTANAFASTALRNAPSLTQFVLDGDNESFSVIDGVLYNKDATELIRYPAGKTDVYFKAPASVSSIRPYAFEGCANLRYLDLSETAVTSLPENALYRLTAVSNIDLPAGLTALAVNAVSAADAEQTTLAALFIPASVTDMDPAFFGNSGSTVLYTDSAASAAAAVAAGGGYACQVLADHSHEYATAVYDVTPATCQTAGSQIKTCQCGQFALIDGFAAHTKGDAVGTHAATCSAQGYTTYLCAVCGEPFDDDFTGPSGAHTYTAATVKPEALKAAADCTAAAAYYYSCADCGAVEGDDAHTFTDGEPTDHSWEWIVDQNATCSSEGVKHEECSVCRQTRSENTAIQATGEHSYTAQTVKAEALKRSADCQTAAVYYYSCGTCGTVEHNDEHTFTSGTAADHDYTAAAVKDEALKQAADCHTAATYYYSCAVCGAVESNNAHTFTDGEPAAHNWEWVIDTDADCGNAGVKHEACTKCGDVRNENTSIPATGAHDWKWIVDRDAACSSAGVKHEECSVCRQTRSEDTVIQATGVHSYTAQTVKDEALKTAATCSAPAVYYYSCSGCGAVEHNDEHTFTSGTAASHSYTATTVKPEALKQAADCHTAAAYYYSCAVCGAVESNNAHTFTDGEPAAHSWEWVIDTDADCGNAGVKHEACTKCGDVRNENTTIPASGNHTWEWKIDTPATCRDAGVKHEECAVCHRTRSENTPVPTTDNHSWAWQTDTEPTCGNYGAKHQYCTVCGDTRAEGTAIPPTGNHSWDAGTVTKEATCAATGLKRLTCTVCGAEKDEAIPKTAHTDANGDGQCDNCGADMSSSNACKYCGQTHEGVFGKFIQFFHSILYFFRNLFRR